MNAKTGAVISLLLLVLLPPFIWTTVPYRTVPIEELFTSSHSGAIKLSLDVKTDSRLFSLFEILLQEVTEGSPESVSGREFLSSLPDSADLVAPFNVNMFMSAKQNSDELVLQTIYPESANKSSQLSWFVEGFSLEHDNSITVGDATVFKLETPPSLTPSPPSGATWYKGNYIVGHIGPTMEVLLKDISEDEVNFVESPTFLSRKWPYRSNSSLIAVIENRNGNLLRILGTMLQDCDFIFENMDEAASDYFDDSEVQDECDDPSMEEQQQEDALHQEISKYLKEMESTMKQVEGITIEGYYNNSGNLELPVAFHILPDSDISKMKDDFDDIINEMCDLSDGMLRQWECTFRDGAYGATVEVLFPGCETGGEFDEEATSYSRTGFSVSAEIDDREYNFASDKTPKKYYPPTKKKTTRLQYYRRHKSSRSRNRRSSSSGSNTLSRSNASRASTSYKRRSKYRKTYRSYRVRYT